MDTIIKTFDELTAEELFEIYRLRVAVFVVEQNCPYQEVDDTDKSAVHIYMKSGNGIQAYLRVIPQGIIPPDAHIGRVIAVKRRCGLGTLILNTGIRYAKERLHADAVTVDAQVYARKLYENCGFVQTSDEFTEDGIPHIRMRLKL